MIGARLHEVVVRSVGRDREECPTTAHIASEPRKVLPLARRWKPLRKATGWRQPLAQRLLSEPCNGVTSGRWLCRNCWGLLPGYWQTHCPAPERAKSHAAAWLLATGSNGDCAANGECAQVEGMNWKRPAAPLDRLTA